MFRLCILFPPLCLRLTERLLQCGLPLPLRIREQFLCLLHSQSLVFFRLVFSLLDLLNRIFNFKYSYEYCSRYEEILARKNEVKTQYEQFCK